MGKLIVTIEWPYSNIPWVCVSSLMGSDVMQEENKEIIRAVATDMSCTANMLVRAALEHGATEILFLSADQTVPPDILSRLRAHDKEIVGCLTATRQPGHHWLVFNLDHQGIGHQINPSFPFQKVDVIGPGCMLVKASVFQKVPPPWFKTTLSADGCSILQTHDFYFFKKMKEHGVGVYIDSTLESYHQTELLLNTKTLGRKLPYLEVLKNNAYLPVTAAEQDMIDMKNGKYSNTIIPLIEWKEELATLPKENA